MPTCAEVCRAGQILGVNPTTVGRRLRRLEIKLGQTLFEQTREGQVLTEAGEALLVRVETMANAAAWIDEKGGRSTSLNVSGTLRISVSEGFGSWFLSAHLERFVSAHPALTVDLVANSGFLSLSKREADIAVMLSRPKAGPVVARKLANYALGLYANVGYLNTRGTPQTIDELADGHRLIGYIPDLLYAPELRYLDELGPGLDNAFASLLEDLDARGMLDDTAIVVMSEHGRTPVVQKVTGGGRDHWSRAYSAMFAGAAFAKGRVVGRTDRIAGEVTETPFSPKDIVATLFHLLGIDPQEEIHDRLGRPYLIGGVGRVRNELLA